MPLNVNMRFNLDTKVILKKWLVQLMCMVRFLCRLDIPTKPQHDQDDLGVKTNKIEPFRHI